MSGWDDRIDLGAFAEALERSRWTAARLEEENARLRELLQQGEDLVSMFLRHRHMPKRINGRCS